MGSSRHIGQLKCFSLGAGSPACENFKLNYLCTKITPLMSRDRDGSNKLTHTFLWSYVSCRVWLVGIYIALEVTLVLEVMKSSFRISGNTSFACNEKFPTCFQLTSYPSFIKVSCSVWQLQMYCTATHVTVPCENGIKTIPSKALLRTTL